jgi:hypothetical protein
MEKLDVVFDPLPDDTRSRLVVDGLHARGIAATGDLDLISFVLSSQTARGKTDFRANGRCRRC